MCPSIVKCCFKLKLVIQHLHIKTQLFVTLSIVLFRCSNRVNICLSSTNILYYIFNFEK